MSSVAGRTHHLAVFNVARLRAPLESQQLADFVAGLDPVNALGEQAPGFVWRYVADGTNNATAVRPLGDNSIIVNLGVWESREHLWDFVYRSPHLDLLRRRREWFTVPDEAYLVLWWVPAGHIPSLDEAIERLRRLQSDGPGPHAFTFREPFEAPTNFA